MDEKEFEAEFERGRVNIPASMQFPVEEPPDAPVEPEDVPDPPVVD